MFPQLTGLAEALCGASGVGIETSHVPGRSVLVVLSVFPHSLLKVIFTGCVNASHIVHPPVLIPVSLDVHI